MTELKETSIRFLSGKGSQNRSYERYPNAQFRVSLQKKTEITKKNPTGATNTYAGFDSINSFYDWKRSYKGEPAFYEQLCGKFCEIYDLDVKTKDFPNMTEHDILTEFLDAREEWGAINRWNNGRFNKNNVFIKSTPHPKNEKISFHIIFRKFVFPDMSLAKTYMSEFRTYIEEHKFMIAPDWKIYSNNRIIRMLGSHKVRQPERIAGRYQNWTSANRVENKKYFCASYLEKDEILIFAAGEAFKNPVLKIKQADVQLSNNDITNIFDNISVKRWEDRGDWLKLIWIAKKLKLTDADIQKYSALANNYDEGATTIIIDDFDEDKCTLGLGTLLWYLKQDVDPKIFKELTGCFIQDKVTQIKIDQLTKTPLYQPTEKDSKWVDSSIFDKDKCVVVKAGLGKGKTTAAANHINNNNYERIICLSPRKTFATSLSYRLTKVTKHTFDNYLKLAQDEYIITRPFIIVQAESIHRLELDNRKTLILCDEIESILNQMTSEKTHGKNHVQNTITFEKLIQSASKIICLDAFISPRTLNTLNLMNIPFRYYHYSKQLEKRKAYRIHHKKNFLNELMDDLENNKKVYLFCSSKTHLVKNILPKIKFRFPEKKIFEYHSDFQTSDLTDINNKWLNDDLVAITSSVTVGCNFDVKGIFDNLYVYLSAPSKNLVRDVFQATYRVRHFTSKTMKFFIDPLPRGNCLSTNIDEIAHHQLISTDMFISQYERKLKKKYPNVKTPEWLKQLVVFNTFEFNMSIMKLEQLFYRYLELCNYDLVDQDDEREDETDNEEKQIAIEVIQYDDIPNVDRAVFRDLKQKKIKSTLTHMEEAIIEKYFFRLAIELEDVAQEDIAKEHENQLWDIYNNFGKTKFKNLSYEKGLKLGLINFADIQSNKYPEISSKRALRLEYINKISNILEMKHSQDSHVMIPVKVLEDNLHWFNQHSEKIHIVFDVRNRVNTGGKINIRNVVDLLNKVYSKWGYMKMKKQKKQLKRVDGKRIDITPYKILNVNEDEKKGLNVNAYSHINPKKTRRIMPRNVTTSSNEINPLL